MKTVFYYIIFPLSILLLSAFMNFDNKAYTLVQEEFNLEKSITRGAIVYKKDCKVCHKSSGLGKENKIPPLAKADWLILKRNESIKAIKYGLKGKIEVNNKVYNGKMNARKLNSSQIADVLNYIMTSWGNTQEKIVTSSEVENILLN